MQKGKGVNNTPGIKPFKVPHYLYGKSKSP